MSTDDRFFTLENAAGLRISVLSYGATWDACSVPLSGGARRQVVLGCADAEGYRRQKSALGASIGRYANRIANARFRVDGETHQLTANEGPNQLHGGQGFGGRSWTLVSHDEQNVVLSIHSPDGDQGFPGAMQATATYAIGEDLSLTITYEATVTAPCPVNMTNHVYFNLNGEKSRTCLDHRLRIAADAFLPANDLLIPTGERRSVTGSGFDFREPHRISDRLGHDHEQQRTRGYDHAYWLQTACADGTVPAVEMESGDGLLRMELYTQLPSLQLYTGNSLEGTPNRCGGSYANYAGVALEPQFPPDTPNHPEWPDCVLRPGQTYRQVLRYRFLTT